MNERSKCAVALIAAAVCAAGAGVVVAAQALIPGQSEVAYVGTESGVSVEGSFSRFEAHVNLDPDKPQSGSVAISVDMASVVFPSDEVLKELAKPDWFDTAHFPKSEFRSSSIRNLADGRVEISGALTIKGRTRDVVFPVTIGRSGGVTVASGVISVKRLDFGVGSGEWGDTSLVEDPVQIKFKIALDGKAG